MIEVFYDVVVLGLICGLVWEVIKLRKVYVVLQKRLTLAVFEAKDTEEKIKALCNMVIYMSHTKKKAVKKKK